MPCAAQADVLFIYLLRGLLVVAPRPSFSARRNVPACCPNNGVAGGRGLIADYSDRLTFPLKGTPFCLSATLRHSLISFLAAAVVVFLPVKRALPKLRRLLSAAPCRRNSSTRSRSPISGASSCADKLVCVHKMRWFRRKVAPMFM